MIAGVPWQDVVLSGGNVILGLALLPSVMSKDKPAFTTSVVTSSVLAVFSFTTFTLDLFVSAVVIASVSFLWGILAFQEYRIRKGS